MSVANCPLACRPSPKSSAKTVQFQGQIYLFEFKVVELSAAGHALQQIKDKGYADKYRALGQPIHLIGVEFSRASRNIVGFEIERIS